MKTKITSLAAAFLILASGAHAQEAGGHDMHAMGDDRIGLPDICLTAGGEAAVAGMSMGMAHDMDEAHAALMDGMDEMNRAMMIGMMAEDIDVAFVCGMIPHHQSAVSMARAQLQYGDDEWAKALARQVIDSQQQEIDDMITWLEERAAELQAE